jgi:hypothetical protein
MTDNLPEPMPGHVWLKFAVQVPKPTRPFSELPLKEWAALSAGVRKAAEQALGQMYNPDRVE